MRGLRAPWENLLSTAGFEPIAIPDTMHAAVYRGQSVICVEEVPTPEIGPGELLIRVEACGICNTDLKKIEYNLLAPPRIFGHETAGVVVAAGRGVSRFSPGDRVVAFHHIPCSQCFYCRRGLYAQCPTYKKVGITAGFEPAGGGFAQYVRVMDWIVERGVEPIPDGVSFELATLVEPFNTCHKAAVQCAIEPDDFVLVTGQGPIGLMFTMLARRMGARVGATDTIEARVELSRRCGAGFSWDPGRVDVAAEVKNLTGGRGADIVMVAASVPESSSRPSPAPAPARESCFSRKHPIRSGLKRRGLTFVFRNVHYSVVIAHRWICKKSPQISYLGDNYLWRN